MYPGDQHRGPFESLLRPILRRLCCKLSGSLAAVAASRNRLGSSALTRSYLLKKVGRRERTGGFL